MENDTDESYHRRREQVRRAQKSHRARKAVYIKSLEDEVCELRKQNARFLKGAAASRDIIRQYQQILIVNGLPFPPYDADAHAGSDQTTFNISGSTYATQGLLACIPFAAPSSTASSIDPQPLLDLTTTQIGINFILALEKPCLHHPRAPHPELIVSGTLAASGHAAMLSSPVLAHSPEYGLAGNEAFPADAQWSVPTAELEGLLRLAQDLPLGEAEVTPVQAWSVISRHESFWGVSGEQLEGLRGVLGGMVECVGFGAVIDRDGFEKAVNDMFALV